MERHKCWRNLQITCQTNGLKSKTRLDKPMTRKKNPTKK